MEQLQSLLLDAWRETGRHNDLGASLAVIAGLAARRVPVDCLVVVTFDWARGRAHRRAEALGDPGRLPIVERPFTEADRHLLEEWSVAGALAGGDEGGQARGLLLPGDDWLAGPLAGEGPLDGLLLVRLKPGALGDAATRRVLEALLEPLACALANDRRLHELAALREAAEADKRSALARLGRDELKDAIIGADTGLRPVMERVSLVARLDVPVLLLGETGTGKEVIARTIHEASARSRHPFIRVNCGAIPPELIDSELFGHEKGAFTGATSSRRGWFERADNGTLLLDEVGELPLPAQVRLLRVLQEGTFERVGGERSVSVDVRIVASTHRDLPGMVQNGEFRQDLWYRIAGFPIVLPPLRERREDIPALAAHFASRAARHFGLKPTRLSANDIEMLLAYDWPGNVRELGSVIDRAAILGDGATLEVAAALGNPDPRLHRRAAVHSTPAGAEPERARVALDDALRGHIEEALAACRGRIEGPSGAARRLDINPHTLRAKMRRLGVDWRRFRPA